MSDIEEQTISWNTMLHPNMEAIAQRDVFFI